MNKANNTVDKKNTKEKPNKFSLDILGGITLTHNVSNDILLTAE